MQRPQNCDRKICVLENFSSPGISAQRTSLSLQVWKESAKKVFAIVFMLEYQDCGPHETF